MELTIDTNEFLKDYPELRMQYVFNNCFVISSDKIKSIYQRAQRIHKNHLNDVEIYYSPNYLYKIKPDNSIFDMVNKQSNKNFYFLKEHIFYYQYLLICTESKEESLNISTKEINEIFYRTLMNRLYLLYDNSKQNDNYGIIEIFDVPCIYSIMEPNIVNQIINMKQFSFELLGINKDKVTQLFGINKDIENQSFIFNNLLISLSLSNSVITEEKNISEDDTYYDLNKYNRSVINKEKYLINLSSELFIFNYIIKQFDKTHFFQIPRLIFFCCMFNNECKNIYFFGISNTKRKNERN